MFLFFYSFLYCRVCFQAGPNMVKLNWESVNNTMLMKIINWFPPSHPCCPSPPPEVDKRECLKLWSQRRLCRLLSAFIPQQHSSIGLPAFLDLDSAWKKQPCLGSLSAGALEAGVEGATALALPSVVALEEVAAEAGAATARSLCPGDLEVVDVVEALAARVSIT